MIGHWHPPLLSFLTCSLLGDHIHWDAFPWMSQARFCPRSFTCLAQPRFRRLPLLSMELTPPPPCSFPERFTLASPSYLCLDFLHSTNNTLISLVLDWFFLFIPCVLPPTHERECDWYWVQGERVCPAIPFSFQSLLKQVDQRSSPHLSWPGCCTNMEERISSSIFFFKEFLLICKFGAFHAIPRTQTYFPHFPAVHASLAPFSPSDIILTRSIFIGLIRHSSEYSTSKR